MRSLPRALRRVTALAALLAPLSPPLAEESRPSACGTGVHAAEARGFVFLPQGDVFCPLLADPKAMRSFLSWQRGEFPEDTGTRTIGSIGVADGFALFRVGGPGQGEGLQLGIEAGVFAQFDLEARSKDLLNADYLVGLPVTFRRAGFSARLRLYHQSSHIGDELLATGTVAPAGLAFEAVELLLSQELSGLRVYAGGEYLFGREPDELDPKLAHAGAEVRIGPDAGARFVAGLDLKTTEQQDWDPAWSVRVGIEIAQWNDPEHPPRLFSVVAELYDGPAPYGQFLVERARFWGFGFQFQL